MISKLSELRGHLTVKTKAILSQAPIALGKVQRLSRQGVQCKSMALEALSNPSRVDDIVSTNVEALAAVKGEMDVTNPFEEFVDHGPYWMHGSITGLATS
jgi:hypothetical protein